jgi:hypothetical protein
MRLPCLLGLATALALFCPALAADGPPRRLVIAAPDAAAPAFRDQAAALLPAWRGLIERDFVIETRFGASAFSVVLVGKDGGEKLRRSTPLRPEELFALVDAMPLRQAERRQRAAPDEAKSPQP